MPPTEPSADSLERPSAAQDEPGAGDAAVLLDRYGDLVFNLAVRLTGDRDEAKDLAQDAFVRILRGASSFRGDSSVKTWVCQVVINCQRNRSRWWRRLKRGRAVSLEDPIPGARGEDPPATLGSVLADSGAGPDRAVEAIESRRRIEAEMARLPHDQRTAILLREVEGMSYAEIAEAMSVRVGTVKSRIARARETLRAALADLAPRGATRRGDAGDSTGETVKG